VLPYHVLTGWLADFYHFGALAKYAKKYAKTGSASHKCKPTKSTVLQRLLCGDYHAVVCMQSTL
jgi:hypothetical protein